jgi:hypothetical protein
MGHGGHITPTPCPKAEHLAKRVSSNLSPKIKQASTAALAGSSLCQHRLKAEFDAAMDEGNNQWKSGY